MDVFTFVELFALVGLILYFFESKMGQKVGRYVPAPFWVYFLSILLSTVGALPKQSDVYSFIGLHALPVALVLLLIGAPVWTLVKLGPKALAAMALGMGTMLVGTLVSFVLFAPYLPSEGWKMAGAMLGTWSGGSVNMLAVKEIVALSDKGLGPLIVADTFLSYGWLALLMMGVATEKWFDRHNPRKSDLAPFQKAAVTPGKKRKKADLILRVVAVLLVGVAIAEVMLFLGTLLSEALTMLSAKGWTILLATTGAVLLALTPCNRLEEWDASKVGTFVLYMVLATIGAKTSLGAALDAPAILLFAALILLIHGTLLFCIGRALKFPLFLLATASQANVGGPVSAPIVAGVYRPGAAHIGVLMAIGGAVFGTYIGSLGGWMCRSLSLWLR